jgi:hypothetical protein
MLYFDTTTDQQLSRQKVAERLYPANMPANPTPEQLAPVNVEPVVQTNPPQREPWQQVVEADPVDTDGDGVREQQWAIQNRPLGDVIAERVRLIERYHENVLSSGFSYDFGTKTATMPDGATETAGVRTIQTRPGDRERWQATMQVAQQYIVAGTPNEPMRPFRTADNATIPMTAQDVADALNAMQAHFGRALDALWNHKDAVRASATAEDAFNYDFITDWP